MFLWILCAQRQGIYQDITLDIHSNQEPLHDRQGDTEPGISLFPCAGKWANNCSENFCVHRLFECCSNEALRWWNQRRYTDGLMILPLWVSHCFVARNLFFSRAFAVGAAEWFGTIAWKWTGGSKKMHTWSGTPQTHARHPLSSIASFFFLSFCCMFSHGPLSALQHSQLPSRVVPMPMPRFWVRVASHLYQCWQNRWTSDHSTDAGACVWPGILLTAARGNLHGVVDNVAVPASYKNEVSRVPLLLDCLQRLLASPSTSILAFIRWNDRIFV